MLNIERASCWNHKSINLLEYPRKGFYGAKIVQAGPKDVCERCASARFKVKCLFVFVCLFLFVCMWVEKERENEK
jgi:hypothetical protein